MNSNHAMLAAGCAVLVCACSGAGSSSPAAREESAKEAAETIDGPGILRHIAELSDGARSEALRKLTYRALWWFRFAALLTFLFGILLFGLQGGDDMKAYMSSAAGTAILTGMLFGITMFLNVWGVIWRNQKIVIGNAENVANGGEANPDAPAAAKKAARASDATPVLVPMLWFMVFTAHSGFFHHRRRHLGTGCRAVLWPHQASALGHIGGFDSRSTSSPSTAPEHDLGRASSCWQ
jgi:hypothetical protein